MSLTYFDISKELFSSTVYPGDPAPSKKPFLSIEKGDVCNLTEITLGSHNGTHLDAPKHFVRDGLSVAEIPLDKTMGPCKLVSASGEITASQMQEWLLDGTKKLLIRGDILLTPEASSVMAKASLDLIGVEGQTVGLGDTQVTVHQILLGAGIIILEGLVLSMVPEDGAYFLSAAPIKMDGLDGSPIRPVLISYSK